MYAFLQSVRILNVCTVQDTIIRLIDQAQAATEADFQAGKITAKGVHMLHKFTDPVAVDIRVRPVLFLSLFTQSSGVRSRVYSGAWGYIASCHTGMLYVDECFQAGEAAAEEVHVLRARLFIYKPCI